MFEPHLCVICNMRSSPSCVLDDDELSMLFLELATNI
jgi:hypothetical protein